MIDNVFFELPSGEVVNSADYGLILKSFDAPEPKVRTHRVQVDGADGELDMTEWAGVVRFENRTVTIAFRDMQSEGYKQLVNHVLGRNCKIFISSDPAWYFYGRCDGAGSSTRKRVTDTPLVFTCQPYKLRKYPTIIRGSVTSSGTSILVRTLRRSAIPKIKLTAACTIEYNGATYSLAAGTHTVAGIVITDTPKIMVVKGSGNVTITFDEGVI